MKPVVSTEKYANSHWLCCRSWRHGWPRGWTCSHPTDCLTHSASTNETTAADRCPRTSPQPLNDHHSLLRHAAHLTQRSPSTTPPATSDSFSACIQTCSTTNTPSHNCQCTQHPPSGPHAHPNTSGVHAQHTPHSYCTRFGVPPLSHPSSQSRHPGRGSQTYCPPYSFQRNQHCPLIWWSPAHQPHNRAPGGSPWSAPTCPLPPTSSCHTAGCRRPHYTHTKPHPPADEWSHARSTDGRTDWQTDNDEHPNGGPPPAADGSDGPQSCDHGYHALVSN